VVEGGERADCCSGTGAGRGRLGGGACAAGIHSSQLFRWRQQLCEPTQVPAAVDLVAIAPEPGTESRPSPERTGVIEIEFVTGGRMRITGPVDALTVSALMKALAKSKRRR